MIADQNRRLNLGLVPLMKSITRVINWTKAKKGSPKIMIEGGQDQGLLKPNGKNALGHCPGIWTTGNQDIRSVPGQDPQNASVRRILGHMKVNMRNQYIILRNL